MDGSMATIALVDDDRDVLALVATMLESEGYRVVAYSDGPAALAAVLGEPAEQIGIRDNAGSARSY